METTLVLLKPDCLRRSLAGSVLTRFEQRGLAIVGLKMLQVSDALLAEHYRHIADKPFFAGVVASMQAGPIVAVALRGLDAADVARAMAGSTNARQALPGTIRGDLSVSIQQNIVHISEDTAAAAEEIPRFFDDSELFQTPPADAQLLYSKDECA